MQSSSVFWTDPSFLRLIENEKSLNGIMTYLPIGDSKQLISKKIEKLDSIHSSYKQCNYKLLFYGIVRQIKPDVCVEIGVLEGYSLFSMALALQENANGKIFGFDLFEDYEFRHERLKIINKRIKKIGLEKYISLTKKDAFDIYKDFNRIDLLHVDISNNGKVYSNVFKQWSDRVKKIILLEGGSIARDNIDWMKKYQKPPINPEINKLTIEYPNWKFYIIQPYPSITIAVNNEG